MGSTPRYFQADNMRLQLLLGVFLIGAACALSPVPSEIYADEEECKDLSRWCHYHTRYGACNYDKFAQETCPKTCGRCNTEYIGEEVQEGSGGEPTAPPTTAAATTAKPTTAKPTTAKSTTAKPTTAKQTTAKPTTAKPTTAKPTTLAPT